MKAKQRHQVVVVGGGFGGVRAVKALDGLPVDITLIDKTNHHLFQPLLYQVATGVLSPGQIAPAFRAMMRKQKNVQVKLAEVTDFDVENRFVKIHIGQREEHVAYDTLIVAAGATHSYFGNDQWAPFAPGMKTLDDARRLRSRILSAFEMAEQAESEEERRAYLSFAVVGGGPTGVELAGQISQLAHKVLRGEYRHISSTDATITIVDASPSLLGPFHEKLRNRAKKDLQSIDVEVLLNARVNNIDENGIHALQDGQEIFVPAKTTIWAAGVAASPLGKKLAQRTGIEITDRAGRISVEDDLSLKGHPEIFAIGDMVAIPGIPGVAQPAIQEGQYVADVIKSRLTHKTKPKAFQYRDMGSMATIGRSHAVAEIKNMRFTGLPAFFLWGIVHVAYLVGWGNRFGAVMRWMWTVLARNRRERVVSTAAIEEAQIAQQRALQTTDHNSEAQISIGHEQKRNIP